MAAQVTEITRQVSELTRMPWTETTSWTEPLTETVCTNPEPFYGELDKCRGFLLQCNIVFQQRSGSFNSDVAKILSLTGLL